MNKIDWCNGGLQLEDIATKNVDEHYLTPRMKYIYRKNLQLIQNTFTRGVT